MTEYIWELGIDWNAVETADVSYLRGGLTTVDGVPLPGTNKVYSGDQITFRVFDVSSSVKVDEIGSFVILTKAAVNGQIMCNSLSSLQPAITLDDPILSQSTFGSACCSWTCSPVTVTADLGRFLLTVQVQAIGTDQRVRLFRHDPEMVVGPNG